MADTMEWTGRTVEAALEAAAADLGCAPALRPDRAQPPLVHAGAERLQGGVALIGQPRALQATFRRNCIGQPRWQPAGQRRGNADATALPACVTQTGGDIDIRGQIHQNLIPRLPEA